VPFSELLGKIDAARARRENLGPVELEYEEALRPLREAALEFRTAVEKFVF
jgi:hypothetical protein